MAGVGGLGRGLLARAAVAHDGGGLILVFVIVMGRAVLLEARRGAFDFSGRADIFE